MTDNHSTNQTNDDRAKRRLPRGRVTVFPNWCKGCDLCIEFCPMEVLGRGEDGRVMVVHGEKCTACRWCELHCPDFAIFVSDLESENDAYRSASEEENE